MSDTSHLCPKCGEPIPPDSPEGLCPKCLLRQASVPTESGKSAADSPKPPSHEEMTAAFPHLEILELIGQGGMGYVFKARQPKLDRLVALKILPQSRASDPAFAERFGREGRLLARLNHPNIVTIHDFGQAGGFFYLLMEFVDGVNLRQAMQVGRFTPAQALALVPKICEALQFAHDEGVLHRDIKPENILLDSKGRVKIADFGIAKLVSESPGTNTLTATGSVVGTPQYMAPEQLERSGKVDQRADIYSLGVVFYEMLTGELPLGKFQPPSQKVEVDVRLDEVVLHALEKDPARRYQQASQVKTAVDCISSGPPPIPPAVPPSAPASASAAASHRAIARSKSVSRGAKVGLTVCFLIALAATVATFLLPATHRGTARIRIYQFQDPAKSVVGQNYDPYLLQNEFQIIQSEAVLTNVIARLKLQEKWSARFGDANLSDIRAVDLLRSMLDFRPVRNSMVVDINVFEDRPGEAAEIANAIARQYADFCLEKFRVRAEIIDRAVPILRPARPNKPLNIVLGIFVGLLVGATAGLAVGLISYWKLATAPLESAQLVPPRPDRFWRRMAVAGLLLFTVPLALGIVSVVLYRIMPGFVKPSGTAAPFPLEPPAATSSDQGSSGPEQTPVAHALVIDAAPFDVAHPPPHSTYWGFNGFIPPAQLASFVFVVWSNGVPTIDPGFSTYFKVGKGGGIDIPFCLLDCCRVLDIPEFSQLTDTQMSNSLAAWKYPESAGVSNAVRWDVNLGAGSTGSRLIPMPLYHQVETTLQRVVQIGHQAVVPLIEFDQPVGTGKLGDPATAIRVHDPDRGMRGLLPGDHGRSGVELRIFLEPLASSPIRALPMENDQTNYVVGKGIAWTIEQTLHRIKSLPIDP